MSSNADRHDDAENPEQSGESPILRKVRATLLKTPVQQWKEGGDPLDSERKYPKTVDTWEHIYLLELKKGFLVLRCSTPVLGNFQGGAYTFSPRALPEYTVELRDRSWDHRDLTDILRRPATGSPAGSSKVKIETLANGETARDLFESVEEQVTRYFEERDAEFETVVNGLLATLDDLCQNGFTSQWQKKSEHGGTVVWFRTKMNEVQIAAGRQSRKDSPAYYKLILSNSEGLNRTFDDAFARRVFEAAEDHDRNAGLLKLEELLTDLE